MLEAKLYSWIKDMPDRGVYHKDILNNPFLAMGSDIGIKRKENQDRVSGVCVNTAASSGTSFCTLALCDGMGGMADGAGSASVALSTFLAQMIQGRRLEIKARIWSAALAANEAVMRRKLKGGSTLSAVTISNGRLYTVNIGDSRIYSVSNSGEVKRHSQDDNLKEAFGGNDEALLQYIGMGEGITPHIAEIDENFEYIFLTSDGVHNLEASMLNRLASNAKTPVELCSRLIKTAVWTGGDDNASVAVISRVALKKYLAQDSGANIVAWSPKGELQVIWTDPIREQRVVHVEQGVKEKNTDVVVIKKKDNLLNLQGGSSSKGKKKTRKKRETKPKLKVSFGDVETD